MKKKMDEVKPNGITRFFPCNQCDYPLDQWHHIKPNGNCWYEKTDYHQKGEWIHTFGYFRFELSGKDLEVVKKEQYIGAISVARDRYLYEKTDKFITKFLCRQIGAKDHFEITSIYSKDSGCFEQPVLLEGNPCVDPKTGERLRWFMFYGCQWYQKKGTPEPQENENFRYRRGF